jgi:isopentenyl phosphate kinase
MHNLTLVKLGGSLITDKSRPFTARKDVIRRLCMEIKEAREKRCIPLIVGHGGGSFPHSSAAKYQTHKGAISEKSWMGICVVQNDAAKLNRIIIDTFLDVGEKVMSVQPSSACVAEGGRIKEYYTKSIEMLLENGVIPVPYGDVALDVKQGMCIISTEEILLFLAEKLNAKRVIFCGKTDGVFTADPNKDKSAKIIKEITNENFDEVKKHLTGSDGVDVTGGMTHKVERALEIAKKGITVEIINGKRSGILKKSLLGEEGLGTIIKWNR